VTQSYQLAFTIATVTSFIAVMLTIVLKKVRSMV